jgi:uncharacterized protein YuzE
VRYKPNLPSHSFLHEETGKKEKGMAVVDVRGQDLTRLLKAVRQLVRFPVKQMSLDYDAEADVLYISFRRPQHATDSELREDGIIVHRRGKQVVGLTILEASNR